MLPEALMALAALAGNTVVAAATTDAWEAARRKFARLLGRGDPKREQLAEGRLEETRQQLTRSQGTELEEARVVLAAQWATRLTDMLEEDPDVEADLRAIVQEFQATLPAGTMSAADHAFAAARDINIFASAGGVAGGVIHGNVTPPNPIRPGPAKGSPGPGSE